LLVTGWLGITPLVRVIKNPSVIGRVLAVLLFCALGLQPVPAQTSQPVLRIALSNGVNTVFWPLTGSNFILQAKTDLSSTATWTNLTTGNQNVSLNTFPSTDGYAQYITNVVGDEITCNLPVVDGQRFFRLRTPQMIPACSFAVFYNGLLEFSQSPSLVFNGRVHANGPIYVGSSVPVTFNSTITTASNLSAPFADGLATGWTPSNPNAWNFVFNGNPGYITNATSLGIAGLNPTNYHSLIDIPPASEDPRSTNGILRLFNQAAMILIVTNDIGTGTHPTVRLSIQASVNGMIPGIDPTPVVYFLTNASPARLNTNLPFLTLTNQFYDQREYKTNYVTQIDVGRFSSWASTNQVVQSKLPSSSGIFPTILYVADRRNVSSKQLAVVRVTNGAQLPGNNGLGFTLATPNPLYVWGNYNVQTSTSAANASADTANTDYTVPAALISDALTVLSPNWADSDGYSTYFLSSPTFAAADMTINAAIITGTVASTGTRGTTFSGGVHNLPRLLESWPGKNLWLNTSFIRLWDSQWATNQFRNPDGFTPIPVNPYYNPPSRRFNFDFNFLFSSKIPPGVPMFIVTP